jgi:pimeloyl-ACP methyl ester carboxylesterase
MLQSQFAGDSTVSTEKAFRLDRTALSFRTYPGSAGTLLLLHGVLTSHRYFSEPLGGKLGPCRLVLPDLLGFGASSRPDAGYTLSDHLACLRDLVEAEGLSRPLFIGGHSMGALIATALAASLPAGRVAGLVYFNFPRFVSPEAVHGTLRNGSRRYRDATDKLGGPAAKAPGELTDQALPLFARSLPASLQEEAMRTSPIALARTVRHCLFDYRADPDLERMAGLPMLFLLGGRDEVAPPAFILERRDRLAKARWIEVPDAGHHLLHTHADLAARALRDFLRDSQA